MKRITHSHKQSVSTKWKKKKWKRNYNKKAAHQQQQQPQTQKKWLPKEHFSHSKIQCILFFFMKALKKRPKNMLCEYSPAKCGYQFISHAFRAFSFPYSSYFQQIRTYSGLCAVRERASEQRITLSKRDNVVGLLLFCVSLLFWFFSILTT